MDDLIVRCLEEHSNLNLTGLVAGAAHSNSIYTTCHWRISPPVAEGKEKVPLGARIPGKERLCEGCDRLSSLLAFLEDRIFPYGIVCVQASYTLGLPRRPCRGI